MKSNQCFLIVFACFLSCCKPVNEEHTEAKHQFKSSLDSIKLFLYTDPARARTYADRAASLAETIGEDTLRMAAQINQGHACMFSGEFSKAQLFYDSVLHHPQIRRHPTKWVQAMGGKANTGHFALDFKQSETHFRQLLDFKKLTGDQAANAWLNFGAMLMTAKDFGRAAEAFQKSDSLQELGFGDQQDRIILVMNLAGSNFNLADYPRAVRYYQRAIAMEDAKAPSGNAAFYYNSMAHCYIQMDSLLKVPALLDSARANAGADSIQHIVADIRECDYHSARNDSKTALEFAIRANEAIGRNQNKYYLVYNVTQLLFNKNKLGQLDGTPALIKSVYRDCPTCLSSFDSLQMEEYDLLYHTWQSGPKENYQLLRDHLSHLDGYYRLRQEEAIHEQELRYQTAKNEQKNKILMLGNRVQRQQIIALILGVLLLAAIVLVLFFRNRRKTDRLQLFELKRQQLEHENRELTQAVEALKNREIGIEQVLTKSITLSSGKVLPLGDILYLEASGDSVHFHTIHHDKLMDTRMLKHWADKLEQTGTFLRIHRQYVVNAAQISARPAYNSLQVGGEIILPVGRTFQGKVGAFTGS